MYAEPVKCSVTLRPHLVMGLMMMMMIIIIIDMLDPPNREDLLALNIGIRNLVILVGMEQYPLPTIFTIRKVFNVSYNHFYLVHGID